MTLKLDMDAVITDVSLANAMSGEIVKPWVGRRWIDTVSENAVDKIRRTLEDVRSSGFSAFRQITQQFPSGLEIPIEYTTVRLGGSTGFIAIGKSLQATAELQSRLIAAQQAMEGDYWKLREVETRYRLLFDASNEAVLVLKSDDLRVVEANPAAIRALGLTRGWDFLAELARQEHEAFRTMLAGVRETGRAPGGVFHLGLGREAWILRASLMNGEAAPLYMLQLVPVGESRIAVPARAESVQLAAVLDRIPDAVVIVDRDGIVRRTNQAFLDLVQAGADGAVIGRRLDQWLRQPGADMSVLLANLRRHGVVRLFGTTLTGDLGSTVDVELSAAGSGDGDAAFIGVVLRDVSRRLPVERAGLPLPALPALNGQPGATPLRELVQAAVGIVERHYVESALQMTEGNRTAAAELLGLSRQSLYSKLSRYGLESGKA